MKNNFKKYLSVVLIVLSAITIFGCSKSEEKTGEDKKNVVQESKFEGKYIVDANYTKEKLDSGEAILVDARGEENAKKGTIEGAIVTSWQSLSNVEDVEKGDYEWGLTLNPEELSSKLSELGIEKDKEIILFAEGPKGWGEDGKVLSSLRAAGYQDLKMVDGGLNALITAGLPGSKDITKHEKVDVKIDDLDYKNIINTKELEASIDEYVVLDVREDEEFNGEVLYGEAKGGRLPNAIQVRFVDLFDSNGYLKSNDDIKKMFEQNGIKDTDKVVVYCTSGIRSAYTQLILEMLGYADTKNYEGSYNTWCVHNEVEK